MTGADGRPPANELTRRVREYWNARIHDLEMTTQPVGTRAFFDELDASGNTENEYGIRIVGAKAVGIALYGPYLLAVELASMLLLGGLVAAYHLGRHHEP